MLSTALRFIFLRFLPRRLVPILTAIEVVRLVQRWRRPKPVPAGPRRVVTSDRPPRSETDPPTIG
jgi:hypothetical protein